MTKLYDEINYLPGPILYKPIPQAPAPVRVKPLEWGEKNGAWDARTAFGTGYTVADSQWTYGPTKVWFYSDGGNEAAKAAAQADYEARIIAALEAPDAGVVAERDDALTFLDNAVSKSPQPLKDLGAYLASLLDEDDWPEAERYLNAAVKSCAAITDGGTDERG